MTTWGQLLDDYEATIEAVEALAASNQEPVLEAWLPPMDLPTSAPSRAEWLRFTGLQERAAVCDAQLRRAIADGEAELEATRRIGLAARAYARSVELEEVRSVQGA